MPKWNKKLGTSKREQGIATPKAPQNRGLVPLGQDPRERRGARRPGPLGLEFAALAAAVLGRRTP